jgi:hypothetical protein
MGFGIARIGSEFIHKKSRLCGFFVNCKSSKKSINMKKSLSFIGLILLSYNLLAQVTDMGGPYTWTHSLNSNIPLITMSGYDQNAVDAEDVINDQTKDQPWRFGYKYDTNISSANAGTWTTLQNGDRIWQTMIECPGAMTINLLLENYQLPEGAYLYLYDFDQTNRVGAYTDRNNRPDGMLGTELVHGDRIIVEYYEPAAVSGQGSFNITSVVHGYRSLSRVQQDLLKGLNDSGNCNVDVNCPLGNGWEDQIKSVAMIVINGNGICTGALINNNCNDGTPYFLTANHCLPGSNNVSNWAFRFNWDSPPGTESCATTTGSTNPGPPYDQTANGATILASGGVADFALLEIDNMTLADAQNWNLFYAGWDNSDAQTVSEAVGIHHPSGDVKKICIENNGTTHQNWNGAACWRVSNWDEGVTEPGSSGSPLFDQNKRIIGQLYGGGAACSGTNDNGQPDWYGRLGVSWNNGVSTYLTGSCGTSTTNDGYDPNAPTCAGTITSTTIEETCFGDDDGSITVSVSGGDGPFQYTLGGNTQASGTFSNLAQGSYSIQIEDNNNCISNIQVTLDGPDFLSAGFSKTHVSCNGGTDGELTVNVAGGTSPYTYDIGSGSQGSSNFNGLTGGTYTVTVTDANNCTYQNSTTINEPTILGASATASGEVSGNDGAIDLSVTGGSTPYSYAWTGPNGFTSSDQDPTGLVNGSYQVTVTDFKGCTYVLDVDVVEGELSINENRIEFSIFPNPSSGMFVVQHNSLNDNIDYYVLDITGRTIIAPRKVAATSFEIDLTDKAVGTYFLVIEVNEEKSVATIVKK